MEKEDILRDLKIKLFDKMLIGWDAEIKKFDLDEVRNCLTTYSNMLEVLENGDDGE